MGFQFAGNINNAKVHIFVTEMTNSSAFMIYAIFFEALYY